MNIDKRLAISLLLLRISVFIVMLVWTVDKFTNPEHASDVFKKFYFIFIPGNQIMYLIGAIELIILVGFIAGVKKQFTYGAVLLFHAVSTLASYQKYLAPYDGNNALFFAAWPMLAACITLYLLREQDNYLTIR
ncbi:MAG: hypothetical protein HY356_08515 [Gammaproteobacteria bacterium]|nr:hypothetical protein [Gammaproteobacteria bacterium]